MPGWQAWVDGQETPIVTANIVWRGVAVPAGEHTVEFRFNPPTPMLWVSLSAIGAGLACVGVLVATRRKEP